MKNNNDSYIKEYLNQLGNIKLFYIVELDGPSSKVIVYVDSNNEQWCLMDDDDQLVDDCYEYLKRSGVEVITSTEDRKDFERKHKLK